MNHEYWNKIANESRIIGVKKAGIMNIEDQMIPLPPPTLQGTSLSDSSLRCEPFKETVAETSPWELFRLCVDLNMS